MKKSYTEKGFSLLEALVTLVLLTIGILGLVAMQGKSINLTSDSIARNSAVMLANEMMETLRSNPTQLNEFILDTLPEADGCENRTQRLAADTATKLACWSAKTRLLLPGTDGDSNEAQVVRETFRVCRSAQPDQCDDGSTILIRVAWRSNGAPCNDTNDETRFVCQFTLRGEL